MEEYICIYPLSSNETNIPKYICVKCGDYNYSNASYEININDSFLRFYICQTCGCFMLFCYKKLDMPEILPAENALKNYDPLVKHLLNETKTCIKHKLYTSSVLGSEKLLSIIAASKGTKEKLELAEYVDYMVDNGYKLVGCRDWIDHCNLISGSTKESPNITKEDAEEFINFLNIILISELISDVYSLSC